MLFFVVFFFFSDTSGSIFSILPGAGPAQAVSAEGCSTSSQDSQGGADADDNVPLPDLSTTHSIR